MFVVGFVMPSGVAVDDVPEPADSSVRTRRVPAQTAAALTFSGRWSRRAYDARTKELLDLLAKAELTVEGRPRYAASTRRGHHGSCGGTKWSSR